MALMVTVAEARAMAARRVERDRREWAVSDHAAAVLDLPLHPPKEREVRADAGAAQDWVRSWRAHEPVQWVQRSWPSFGTQQVPDRLILSGADSIAAFAGDAVDRGWRHMRGVVATLRDQFGDTERLRAELRRTAGAVAELPEADVVRLTAVLGWLIQHPDSGLRPRQLPVHGVHSKWLERHRSLVTRLHSALTERTSLGLEERSDLVRIRVLDPVLRLGGLQDLSLPTPDLARLPTPPEVLILENQETLLSLPPLAGTIAILGAGYGVGGRLRDVPWLRSARIRYWGDLDSHGFRILDDLRATFPLTETVLMDTQTVEAHRDLAVQEERIATGSFGRLTDDESAALDLLRAGGGLRIEQERLDWKWVLHRL